MTAKRRFRYLFSPIKLGPVTVANRIVFAAHLTNYAIDGRPSDQHAAYYAARAAGGAGLIITEEHSVHPTDWPYEKLIHGYRSDVVPGYRRITDAVHRYGVPIFAQINHNGGQASGMYSRLPVWAPSPVADPLFREVPMEIGEREIGEIISGYARVARHCVEGGFDGVKLQCSHSSIVRGFLSPTTNRRSDRYGGSLENRVGLLLEIVAAVRSVIGRNLALGVRICGDEFVDGGLQIEDAVAVARAVERTGLVDYINTSIGVATSTLFLIEASMHIPPGYALFIPSAIRKAVKLPVIGVGRFKDPLQAERALEEGHCDLVGIVRGQIADPEFAAKARSGFPEEIRLCLSCNQECVGRVGFGRWLGCIENPMAGQEARAVPARSKKAKRVLVAGAGPGGLQAAISAAARGHRVTVYEKEPQPGGQVRLAARIPSRAEFGDLVRNQLAECRRLGVEIRCGVLVDAALVQSDAPDVIVVATGSEPLQPPWMPAVSSPDMPRVVDIRDVLEDRVRPTGRVLVIDELGFHQATSVAELLADRGCAVEIVSSGMVVGQDLGVTLDMEMWCARASAKGIAQTAEMSVLGIDGAKVSLLHWPSGRAETREPDWVVLAVPQRPADALYWLLKREGCDVYRVGDCVAPRRAHAAVIEGQRVGEAI